jgi:hypothetical protein
LKAHFGQGKANANQIAAPAIDATETASQISS